MIRNTFFFLILTLIIFGCSPKVVKQTSTEEYREDLSSIRPPIDSVTIKEQADEVKKAPYTAPEFDQTTQLSALVDSLAKDNLRKKYTFYTIQVYVGKSREEANEVRSKVYKIIPEETPKLEWSQPNFRVKVGKFENRLDAYKTFSLLKRSFPSALLVTDKSYLSN